MIHCPLIRHSTIKEKALETQGTTNHTQILYEITIHSFPLKNLSLTNLTVEGGSADATPACYSSTQFILQVLHLQGRPYSQQHLFAMTRSSIVDFLHQQDPFKKNPPMKNLHFPTKFGHQKGYSSMSFLVRKMKICQRCRIIFYL